MNVDFIEEDIITLQKTTDNDVTNTHSNRIKLDDQLRDITEGQQCIIFPAFDLSTKIIEFENESNIEITVAYEIKCYPDNSTLLKSLLIKSSILYPIPPSDSNIYCIPHGLIQSTNATTVKNYTTQQTASFLKPASFPYSTYLPQL